MSWTSPSFDAGLNASDSSVHSSAVFDSRLMIQKPPMNYCCAHAVNLMTELPATGIQTAICVTFIIIFFNMRRSQSEDLLCAYESSGQKGKASVGSCALTQMRCGVTQEKIALQGKRWRDRLRTSRFLTLKNEMSLTCQRFRGSREPHWAGASRGTEMTFAEMITSITQ